MTIDPLRRAAQGAAAHTQLLSNVQIHGRASARARKSRSFCTYKITSHLHIPHPLKVPQFQRLAPKSRLTPLACADTRMGGGGLPGGTPMRNPLTGSYCVFSRLHTPNLQPAYFQQVTHSGGGWGYRGAHNRTAPGPTYAPHSHLFVHPMTIATLMNKAKARTQGRESSDCA